MSHRCFADAIVTDRVGFVGLGVMGRRMVRNLLHAGFTVVATTRSREVLARLAEEGVAPSADPADVARKSDVVITMLPTSEIHSALLTVVED